MTGIMADVNGNYAFDNLDGVEEVNLIEIEVHDSIDEKIEDEITRIAFAIAAEYSPGSNGIIIAHSRSVKAIILLQNLKG